MADDLVSAVRASAGRLGIDPVDLLTTISFETGGSFDPWKAGPAAQWGQHRGLLQWGEPQRAKYGVTQDMSVADQMRAAERYLTDAGVKPGHGLLDIYSAVNAGRVGLYDRSDAANGGTPGTVRDKVANQMAGHRMRAQAMLDGGTFDLRNSGGGSGRVPAPTAQASAAPMSLAPAAAPADTGLSAEALGALMQIGRAAQEDERATLRPAEIDFHVPPALARARALARAAVIRGELA